MTSASVILRRDTTAPILVGAGALVGCLVVAVVDPNDAGNYPLCPFRMATGLDCPGCGTLRAVRALTRGDLLLAVDHNVLTIALLPLLAWAWLAWIRPAPTGRRALPALPPWAGYGIAVTVTLFWIARNLPALSWLGSGTA